MKLDAARMRGRILNSPGQTVVTRIDRGITYALVGEVNGNPLPRDIVRILETHTTLT